MSKSDWFAVGLTCVSVVLGQVFVGTLGVLAGLLLGAIAFGIARFKDDAERNTVSLFSGLPPAMAPAPTSTPAPISAPAPSVMDKSNWPDVLLQCDWPQLFGKAGEAPLVPGFPNWIVRNRPWSLRHPGGGIVYNVKIEDIDFVGYVAVFNRVDSLTDRSEAVSPLIWNVSTKQVMLTNDLESLLSHPPHDCDTSKYAKPEEGDQLTAEIPVSVTYDDKNGCRYRVRYVLHYDFWMEGGRMARVGGIEQLF
jgi:hypothetical protein